MTLLASKQRVNLISMAGLLGMMRKAIETSGQSRYQISKGTGIAESVLSRFMSGETALTVETVERLAAYLGLVIVVRPKSEAESKSRIRPSREERA
jgi:ribosome-binding protein aMBF1 (putative translation factor)